MKKNLFFLIPYVALLNKVFFTLKMSPSFETFFYKESLLKIFFKLYLIDNYQFHFEI